MKFQRVARLADLPEEGGLAVSIDGVEIGLYRVGDRVYAMEDVCPHAGYPLHEGTVEGTRVVCSGHGWEFDLESGLAPGEQDEEPLVRYPVRVEGEDVLVDFHSPIGRRPCGS